MALPNTGEISISQIRDEFEQTGESALSDFYDLVRGLPANGEIRTSDFYSAEGPIIEDSFKGVEFFTTDSSSITVPIHSSTDSTDTVIISAMFENDSTSRPSLSGFSILGSRNGFFIETSATVITWIGSTSLSSISFNSNGLGGAAVISATFKDNIVAENWQFDYAQGGGSDGLGPSIRSVNVSTDQHELYLFLAHRDGGNQQYQSWPLDSDLVNQVEYTDPQGAIPGRAAAFGWLPPSRSNVDVTLTDTEPKIFRNSGWYAYFTIRRPSV